ncbi:hypothetical protein OHA72_21965 [Dactylosporangium sp. NBC_01737]|uniref:hypothetical protein n=1 Tax=Dactylosporangium sp. NBC_01737 TaxID=2975959 RepID=UPI002E10985F|nr:hypothetical protein OHA72_21965 [Dactylosporangium sp. NBC_01737]
MTAWASVTDLPVRPAGAPTPVDLSTLSVTELQVVFYAARLPWIGMGDYQCLERLVPIVVEQVNRLGIELVREVARQFEEAGAACDWATWQGLMPSIDGQDAARGWATLFRNKMRRQQGATAARSAWHAEVAA